MSTCDRAASTAEKDGYEAVQLGIGVAKPKIKRLTKANKWSLREGRSVEAQSSKVVRSSASRFRCDDSMPARCRSVRRRISSKGQFVDVTGVTKGKGFAGAYEALELRAVFEASHGVSVSHRSHRFHGQPPGSGQDLQEQEDAGPSRCRSA
jgi:large subunit ribosomal protein L3